MELSDIDLLNPDVYQHGLPHEQLAYLRENAPCFRQGMNEPGTIDAAWLITRYDDVKRINQNTVDFLNYQGVTPKLSGPTLKSSGRPGMTSLDGAEHHRNRRLISQGFTPRAIAAFEASFRVRAASIVAPAIAKGSFDFVTDIAVELPMHVICDLMGVPDEDRYEVMEWANTVAAPMDLEYSPSPEVQMAAVHNLWDYGVHLANLKRGEPGSDLMSLLTEGVDGDKLTNEELMGFTLLLIGAGNETTRNALTLGLHALSQHPEQMAWLRDRRHDVPKSAVEEILRYTTPVVFMRRTAAHDMEIHGSAVAEGDAVLMMYASANFDPSQFADPLALDLTRSPNPHLTFGFGDHFCLGAYVARLEIKLLLEELLSRTEDIRVDAEPIYGRDCYFRPVKRLPVTVKAA